MSIRKCSYKDCNSYMLNRVPNGKFTLFKFPKDPERHEKWMQLGKVNPKLPEKQRLMCSRHFDHLKHVSINTRRTVLLTMAEPFPYKPTEYVAVAEKAAATEELLQESQNETVHIDISDTDDSNQLCAGFENQDQSYEHKFQESDSEEEDTLQAEYLEDVYEVKPNANAVKKKNEVQTDDVCNDSQVHNQRTAKRKFDAQEASSGIKKECLPKNAIAKVNKEGDVIDMDSLIDSAQVSEFQLKTEKYVQMHKSYYIQEKYKLLLTIKKYKDALLKIQQTTVNLNL